MVGISVTGPQGPLWAWPGFPLLCLVGEPVSVTWCDRLCVCCQGRHKGIKPGEFAQFPGAASAVAAGHWSWGWGVCLVGPDPSSVICQPRLSAEHLLEMNDLWHVLLLLNLKYNKFLVSFLLRISVFLHSAM